jgi:hypothetical protein
MVPAGTHPRQPRGGDGASSIGIRSLTNETEKVALHALIFNNQSRAAV